jgi:hypothetical protein
MALNDITIYQLDGAAKWQPREVTMTSGCFLIGDVTTTYPAKSAVLTETATGLTIADDKDIVLGTTNGTCIGMATNQKLAFHGVAPCAQSAGHAALDAYGTGTYGLDSDVRMQALYDTVVAMRAALVAKGLMSATA